MAADPTTAATTLTRSERLDRLPFSRAHGKLLGGSGIGWALDAMDVGMISFVMAALSAQWHLDQTTLSWIGSIGFVGMALGALVAGGVQWLIAPLGEVLAYRPLFVLPLAGSVAAFILVATLREPSIAAPPQAHDEAQLSGENRLLVRLVLANSLNGLGIGMVAPLIAYWFALRFAHGPGSIGPALAASFVLGALGSLLAARLVHRHGLIAPVVVMRGIALALLVAVPLVPAFAPAALLYALRAGFNQGTAGARQALAVGLTRDRRGLAASLQNVSIQIPRAIGPLVAGFMLHAGMLRAPFFVAALLQGGYLVLYVRFFREHAAGAAA